MPKSSKVDRKLKAKVLTRFGGVNSKVGKTVKWRSMSNRRTIDGRGLKRYDYWRDESPVRLNGARTHNPDELRSN